MKREWERILGQLSLSISLMHWRNSALKFKLYICSLMWGLGEGCFKGTKRLSLTLKMPDPFSLPFRSSVFKGVAPRRTDYSDMLIAPFADFLIGS